MHLLCLLSPAIGAARTGSGVAAARMRLFSTRTQGSNPARGKSSCKSAPFENGVTPGQGYQNDLGACSVLHTHRRRGHAPASVSFDLVHHLSVIGTGRIHQQHRVSSGRGMQHKGAAPLADDARRRMKAANSSNDAMSVVHASDSCSRRVEHSLSRWPRRTFAVGRAADRTRWHCRDRSSTSPAGCAGHGGRTAAQLDPEHLIPARSGVRADQQHLLAGEGHMAARFDPKRG
jgi:hypothetical protein